MSVLGCVWLLWADLPKTDTQTNGDNGVLIGVYADPLAAQDGALDYREHRSDGALTVTREPVCA